jgi:5-methylcytosine-specific restriction endonuclease McrA
MVWSRNFKACVMCSGTSFKHMAKGLCSSCYAKTYKKDPKIKARIEAQKAAWYRRHHEANLLKQKLYREQRHFAGHRATVLERDGQRCVECGETVDLVVHHKDGSGRGKDENNNNINNLVTLCRSCHAKVHSSDFQKARKANGYRRPKCGPYKSRHKI